MDDRQRTFLNEVFGEEHATLLIGIAEGKGIELKANRIRLTDEMTERSREAFKTKDGAALLEAIQRGGGPLADVANRMVDPALPYLADAIALSSTPHPAATKAASELRKSKEPAAAYIADLLEGRVVR